MVASKSVSDNKSSTLNNRNAYSSVPFASIFWHMGRLENRGKKKEKITSGWPGVNFDCIFLYLCRQMRLESTSVLIQDLEQELQPSGSGEGGLGRYYSVGSEDSQNSTGGGASGAAKDGLNLEKSSSKKLTGS